MREENVFITLLKLLQVKHTQDASNTYFNRHPHKYDLFGISQMLSYYGIESEGIKLEEKDDLLKLDAPFVAHVSIDFVVVEKVENDEVRYIWNGKHVKISRKGFNEVWSGVVLLVEANAQSIEPNFLENKKRENIDKAQRGILGLAIFLLILASAYISNLYKGIWRILLFILNIIGVVIGYFLVLKQLKVHSDIGDKICSLFEKSDCNDVLNSKAARLWDSIGWSEIGLGYFISNMLIVTFIPSLLPFLVIANICTLPYTFWSVWYQKWKVKQWCPLCLIVQVLLWCIFLDNLFCNQITFPTISIGYVYAACLYLIPMLVVNLVIPKLGMGKKEEKEAQEFASLKMKDEVFEALIKVQPRYNLDKNSSHILFGNMNSKQVITVVTNPHCEPCANLHARIELFLKRSNSFCIQYIFVSFKGLEDSAKYLIAIYYNYPIDEVRKIYSEWYAGGKYKRQEFIKRYPVNYGKMINDELLTQKSWVESANINSTPTIFANGNLLPQIYQLEDLESLELFANL
jgi:hypothetical protein